MEIQIFFFFSNLTVERFFNNTNMNIGDMNIGDRAENEVEDKRSPAEQNREKRFHAGLVVLVSWTPQIANVRAL